MSSPQPTAALPERSRADFPPTTLSPARWWVLAGWSCVISIVTLWPFWLGLRPSESRAFMLRDMFVPYRMIANANTLGSAEGPPRALPQDAIMAIFSPVIPASMLASLLMIAAATLGSWFAAAMAREMAGARFSAQLAVALFVPWNPFVIERLLQGQWTLAAAGMMLPAIAYLAAAGPGHRGLLLLLISACAMVPSGLILAAVVALLFSSTSRDRLCNMVACGLASMPWVLPMILAPSPGAATADPASAAAFAARAETGVGTLGALAGLGGIWNADAIPPSRTVASSIAGVVFAIILLLGVRELWRVYRAVAVVTVAAVVLPALLATGPGIAFMGGLLHYVPGAGLFRDTSKFVALAIPGYVLLIATVVERCDVRRGSFFFDATPRRRPRHLPTIAAAALCGLCVLSVPAYPRDIAPLEEVTVPESWAQLRTVIVASPSGSTLLLPPGNYRMIGDRPVIAPSLKLLPGHPLDPGFLVVDGKVIDGNPSTMRILSDVMNGRNTLRENGVGWVLIDWESVQDKKQMDKAMSVLSQPGIRETAAADNFALYRVSDPQVANSPSDFRRKAATLLGLVLYWSVSGTGASLWLWSLLRRLKSQAGATTAPTPDP